jgi:hypothetical protein
MLASSRVAERALPVVGPPAGIRLAGVTVTHQDQEHGNYYLTTYMGTASRGPRDARPVVDETGWR